MVRYKELMLELQFRVIKSHLVSVRKVVVKF